MVYTARTIYIIIYKKENERMNESEYDCGSAARSAAAPVSSERILFVFRGYGRIMDNVARVDLQSYDNVHMISAEKYMAAVGWGL